MDQMSYHAVRYLYRDGRNDDTEHTRGYMKEGESVQSLGKRRRVSAEELNFPQIRGQSLEKYLPMRFMTPFPLGIGC